MCGLSTFPPAGSSRKRNGKAAAAKVGAVAWASAKPQREQPGAAGRGTEKPRPPKREQQPRQARSHRGSSRETPWDAATGRRRRAGGGRALISEQQKKRGTARRRPPPATTPRQRGSSSPGKHKATEGAAAQASTRGADNRKRPQRGRKGARKKAKARAKPGAGNPTDGARATGKRNGAGKPQGSHQHRAQAAPRRSPAARSFPHAAAKRRSKAKQGEARRSKVFCSLARARGLFPYLDTRQYLLSSENP